MGAKPSKQFERNTNLRQTQKKQFHNIKLKCTQVDKAIKKLKPKKQTEEQYEQIKANILEIRTFLGNISQELIEKNKILFDSCVQKCDDFQTKLDAKFDKPPPEEAIYEPATALAAVAPSPSPKPDLEARVVHFADDSDQADEAVGTSNLEEAKPNPVEKKRKKRKGQKYVSRISRESASFEKIHQIRTKMLPLREEIMNFRGKRDDRTFHYLEESMLRFITELESVELYDLQNLKHERNMAIGYANESISTLKKQFNIENEIYVSFDDAKDKCKNNESWHTYEEIPGDANNNDDGVEMRQPTRDANFRRLLESQLVLDPVRQTNVGLLKSPYGNQLDNTLETDSYIRYSLLNRDEISRSINMLEMDTEDETTDYTTEDSMDDYYIEADNTKENTLRETPI